MVEGLLVADAVEQRDPWHGRHPKESAASCQGNKVVVLRIGSVFTNNPVFQLGWEKARVQKKLGTI